MKDFKQTAYWRALAVLYYASYLPLIIIVVFTGTDTNRIWSAYILAASYIVIVEIIRQAILYILGIKALGVIGTIVKNNQKAKEDKGEMGPIEKFFSVESKVVKWGLILIALSIALYLIGSVLSR